MPHYAVWAGDLELLQFSGFRWAPLGSYHGSWHGPCTQESKGYCRKEAGVDVLTQTGYEKLKATIRSSRPSSVARWPSGSRPPASSATSRGELGVRRRRDEQALLETRILRLGEQLRGARVIDTSDIPKDVVSIGSRSRSSTSDDGETDEYEIVGSAEADPANDTGCRTSRR